ncbi:MAG: poly(A) polymerase [Phycisphaerales bacterium]
MPTLSHTPHDSPQRSAAIEVLDALRADSHTAYLAGGCVRDELLGLAPTDYDIATSATPDQVQALFDRTNAVGASFGVVLVRHHHTTVEVATFRTDGPYSDSRRPDHVTFSTKEHDAHRRDFTINALFLDPHDNNRVIDLVNGVSDLQAGIIRAVGNPDRRFDEDDLRALRAVRFACRYEFEIEPLTKAAITKHAAGLAGVSRERIGTEIRKMLAHQTRAHAVSLMQELTIDSSVLDAEHSGNPPRVLAALAPEASPIAAMLAWAIDRAGEWPTPVTAADSRRALMLSNDETAALAAAAKGLLAMTRTPQTTGHWESLPVAQRKRLATSPGSSDSLAVLAALDPDRAAAINADISSLAADPVGLRPAPLLNGDHLIARGYTPSPGFAPLLNAVYDAQLEGAATTTDDALTLASTLAAHHNVTRHA